MANTHYKYFKRTAESELGCGIVFLEAADDKIVRQVEFYGSKLVWCDLNGQSDDRFMLADQPLPALGLEAENEIAAADFEEAWTQAKAQTPCQ